MREKKRERGKTGGGGQERAEAEERREEKEGARRVSTQGFRSLSNTASS